MSIKTRLLIISILIVVIILLILKIFIFRSEPQSQPEPTVKPSASQLMSPQPSISPKQPEATLSTPESVSLKQKLISLMPVNFAEFNIEYFPKQDLFLVTIKESPYLANKLKSEQWLKDQGIENYLDLNIKWAAAPYVN